MTYIIRLVRAEMMEILQTDYIKFARARGISENSIKYKHALKNGLIPVITIAGINIGTLIAFSIITETVFQWPGMGFYLSKQFSLLIFQLCLLTWYLLLSFL